MRSIKEIFITGNGPSSSHTMGPAFAMDYILKKYSDIERIKITLYGSLAMTGKGHLTDYIIDLKLKNIDHSIIFDTNTPSTHPNTIVAEVNTKQKQYTETIISIGGGTILTQEGIANSNDIYKHQNLEEILSFCRENGLKMSDYVRKCENNDIVNYLQNVLQTMDDAFERGKTKDGYLPGNLKVKRKGKELLEQYIQNSKKDVYLLVMATAFILGEENASGGVVVTAPTCGSCGVIPGCVSYLRFKGVSESEIINGLMVAGLIGIIAKTNASISGAECGCQAEIGVACAMGAAMISACLGLSNEKVAQAAEIALEHSLGLTCDPVQGYVQIPCIERNAMYALKAIDAYILAKYLDRDSCKVSFDDSLKTMYDTGKDIKEEYKETSLAGLSKIVK